MNASIKWGGIAVQWPTYRTVRCFDADVIPVFDGLTIYCGNEEIIVRSETPLRTLSSAVLGGGCGAYHAIVNLKVDQNYHHTAPALDAQHRIAALQLPIDSSISLMTAASLSDGSVVTVEANGVHPGIAVIATTGFSNAAHVLDDVPLSQATDHQPMRPGTVNIICLVDGSITESALAGAIITATEAKCAALQTLDIRSQSGRVATGTTSDAIVIATTESVDKFATAIEYMGLATPTGHALGVSVYQAIVASGERSLNQMRPMQGEPT